MKLLLITPLFLFFSFLYGQNTLIYGTNPNRSIKELKEIHKPLIKFLEKELNVKIKFVVANEYDELINRIKEKTVDFFTISANLYVSAKKQIPNIHYIATDVKKNKQGLISDHYFSYLVSLKSSNIKTINDIKGKRIGFKTKKSTSGYLMPMVLLKQNHIDANKDFKSITFLKKSSKVMNALLEKSVDVIGTSNHRYNKTIKKYGEILHIIKKSKPIPESAICTAPHMSKTFNAKLKRALKKFYNKNPVNSGTVKYSFKNDSFYNPLRELNKNLIK